jgi:RNase P/RNase MRP subunit p30
MQEFYDLNLKFGSEKKPRGADRELKCKEVVRAQDYTFYAYNVDIYSPSAKPVFPEGVFSRVTLKNPVQPERYTDADLIAFRPKNETEMANACLHMDIDIVTVKLHERLSFRIKLNLVHEAIKRGIMFEIAYAPAVRDLSARRNFFANAATLVNATKGRNLILSSGARDLFEQRAPYDVINIGQVLGLSSDQAHAAVTRNPKDALNHGRCRKVFKSVIQVVKTEELALSDPRAAELLERMEVMQ